MKNKLRVDHPLSILTNEEISEAVKIFKRHDKDKDEFLSKKGKSFSQKKIEIKKYRIFKFDEKLPRSKSHRKRH